ncbi:class I SAM-dependent rRNA methyltransferase [Beggiatoa leptomitoformis]|uniref:Methyltransferase n=1 Tax=Beggiatoa leptomitoformis TaxID=288004 RepID=A0A2N9YAH1_9GAMM|nr:class I SAM-dependent rRNA methyltransferase [Beggiatoa leptomitoformis]ALG67133.1 methyltransferase [Beggiatoa leptomitoformis]AUI67467.1 methyltransferase [Beggiatoa leptomitoformis]
MSLTPIFLRKHADRRLRAGHLWIYSNEVDTVKSPLTSFSAGQAVIIHTADEKPIGTGYINPHSLICVRIVSRDPQITLSRSLLVHRLNIALSLRERLFKKPFYRLVFGEGDYLSGLIVDRFDDVLVVQITTAGMELVKQEVIEALDKVLQPRAIVLRNDTGSRLLEGLENYVEVVKGTLPKNVFIEENGVKFHVPVLEGQKTGWFYDHRQNRAEFTRYVQGLRVLDVFSYCGAWGIQAAVAGASDVLCVDSSERALTWLKNNAELNGVADRVKTAQGDAFELLRHLRQEGEKFDVIVLDPPAFIKRRKDQKAGEQAYHRINQMATQLLSREGILVSASCSLHLARETLMEVVRSTGRHIDRHVQILGQGHQAADHPIHPAIPETDYLKALFCRILPSG